MTENRNLRTRLCVFLLSVSMTAASLASCGSGSTVPSVPETAIAPSETAAVSENETDGTALPEKDYGGRTYTVSPDDTKEEFFQSESLTGDLVDDAVFERNSVIEERYNIDIVTLPGLPEADDQDRIYNSILAGDGLFDVAYAHVIRMGSLAMEDLFVNWYDVPYVDFHNPWWAKSNIEDLTYDGLCFLAVGDACVDAITRTYCMFYNKTAGANYDMPDIYGLVDSGKWTFEKMSSLCKDIYADVNENGKKDDADFYGLVSDENSNVCTYTWSFNNKIVTKNEKGELQLSYYSDKNVDIIASIYSLFFENEGTRLGSFYHGTDMFAKGLALFANGCLEAGVNMRSLADDYAIIPYPKWDEAQDDYYTMVDGGHGAFGIPISNPDLEFTGLITEAVNMETHNLVTPKVYEMTIKEKYARDEESIRLLDRIISNRVFDFGFVYDCWVGAAFIPCYMIMAKQSNLATYWAKNGPAIEAHYAEVFDFFNTYKESHK